MCLNKHDGDIIIRWTSVVTEVLLISGECRWSLMTLKGWIWYTTTTGVTIIRIRDNFEVVRTMLKGRYWRKRSSTDYENAEAVMQVFARSPNKSLRQCSRENRIGKSSVDRILRAQKWYSTSNNRDGMLFWSVLWQKVDILNMYGLKEL